VSKRETGHVLPAHDLKTLLFNTNFWTSLCTHITSFFRGIGGNNELFSQGQGDADKTDLLYIITANAAFLPQPLKKARNFHSPPEKSA